MWPRRKDRLTRPRHLVGGLYHRCDEPVVGGEVTDGIGSGGVAG